MREGDELMKHEWERGTTPNTPDGPPEGYSYCAFCSVQEDDDNTSAECDARFSFRPLYFDHEDMSVKSVEGDAPLATMLTSSDFPCISEEDEARCDSDAELYGQVFAVSPELLLFAKDAMTTVCSYLCPSVWKTGESQPHHPLCERGRALIERVEHNPFCEECAGSGECEYALPGFSADLEQSTETGECQTCGGTGRKSDADATQ
jgi:hypothetical protein